MNKTLAQWLEEKYLQWQMTAGRQTLTKFAKYLGMERAYLNMLINGIKTSVGFELALQIAERLDDYEILTILGYTIPGAVPLAHLPKRQRTIIETIVRQIEAEYRRFGVDPNSPEGEAIADSIFAANGFTKTDTVDFPDT